MRRTCFLCVCGGERGRERVGVHSASGAWQTGLTKLTALGAVFSASFLLYATQRTLTTFPIAPTDNGNNNSNNNNNKNIIIIKVQREKYISFLLLSSIFK